MNNRRCAVKKVVLVLLTVLFLSGCSSGMSRDEWTTIKEDCRKRSRVIASKEGAAGSDLTVEEIYQLCIKEAQGRPQTLGDVRDRITE